MSVTDETLRLAAQLRAEIGRITDDRTRALVVAWVEAWDEVAPDLAAALEALLLSTDAKITRAMLSRSQRLTRVLVEIRDRLNALADEASISIMGDLQPIVDTTTTAHAAVIGSQLPDGWADVIRLPDPNLIALNTVVQRTTNRITAKTRPIPAQTEAVIRRELIRGTAAGSNPRATAARMVQRAESGFNFGLDRALVIARTEQLDAHREAGRVMDQTRAEFLAGWLWSAKLDTRTCASCLAQHGQLHDLASPGPLDHPQGRCGRVTKTKPWADLGFAGMDEPADLTPDSSEWFEGLTPAEQIEILGPSRHAAWVAGEFPMDDWSVLRTSDGWRDSFVVAPVPPGYRGGSSSGRVSPSAA